MRLALRCATLLSPLLLSACAVQYSAQDFFARDSTPAPLDIGALQPADAQGYRVEGLSLQQPDGALLAGVHIVRPGSTAVVVFVGGNGFRIAQGGPVQIARLASLGTDVIWLDHRGLGASTGSPSIEAYRQDVRRAVAHARSLGKRVVLHGFSMGSLLAGEAAADGLADALVLEGAIGRTSDLVQRLTPSSLRWLVRVQLDQTLAELDGGAALQRYQGPLWLLVGEADGITPVPDAQALLARAASSRKALHVVPGAGHGNALADADAVRLYREFLAAL